MVTRIVLAISIVLSSVFAVATPRVIDDELVKGLRCDELSVDAIYRSIDPWAFSSDRRVPIRNFGKNMIAQCWALARFQRLGLLLGRKDDSAKYTPATVAEIARGTRYVPRKGTRGTTETPLARVDAFAWPGAGANADSWSFMEDAISRLDTDLGRRKIEDEIADAQLKLFYRKRNLQYLTRSLTPREQQTIFERAFGLIRGNRLPLLNVRFSTFSQHVVVAKSVRKEKANHWVIENIDANAYWDSSELHIELVKGRFKMTFVYPNYRDQVPDEVANAVFIVEEQERSMIDAALLRHYTKACARK